MSDSRRKVSKGVKFEGTRSGSSRASTIGGSSTSSGHSGSQYTTEYNVGALQESMVKTVQELDDWKKRAIEAEGNLRKSEDAFKARIKALELSYKTLEENKQDVEKQFRDLKKEYDAVKKENSRLQRKPEKHENQSEPSSPDSGKPRRSGSRKIKDSEADKFDRLKERFNRTSDNSSEANSKPPSSSRSKHGSGRRVSVSSERPSFMEGRRPPTEYITTNMPMGASMMQSPAHNTPRSTAMPPMRPTVEYDTTSYYHSSRW